MKSDQMTLEFPAVRKAGQPGGFLDDVLGFHEFGRKTAEFITRAVGFNGRPLAVRTLVNEFWTARQRQASTLH
jgi:hypothetical protein